MSVGPLLQGCCSTSGFSACRGAWGYSVSPTQRSACLLIELWGCCCSGFELQQGPCGLKLCYLPCQLLLPHTTGISTGSLVVCPASLLPRLAMHMLEIISPRYQAWSPLLVTGCQMDDASHQPSGIGLFSVLQTACSSSPCFLSSFMRMLQGMSKAFDTAVTISWSSAEPVIISCAGKAQIAYLEMKSKCFMMSSNCGEVDHIVPWILLFASLKKITRKNSIIDWIIRDFPWSLQFSTDKGNSVFFT